MVHWPSTQRSRPFASVSFWPLGANTVHPGSNEPVSVPVSLTVTVITSPLLAAKVNVSVSPTGTMRPTRLSPHARACVPSVSRRQTGVGGPLDAPSKVPETASSVKS